MIHVWKQWVFPIPGLPQHVVVFLLLEPPPIFETLSKQVKTDMACVWQVIPACTSWELDCCRRFSAAEVGNLNLLYPTPSVQQGLKRIFWECYVLVILMSSMYSYRDSWEWRALQKSQNSFLLCVFYQS